MTNERASSPPKLLHRLWIFFSLAHLLSSSALPQNYFEQVAAGALGVANHIAETFQNGAAVRKEMNFQLPGMSMRSKTEVGMGEAIIHHSSGSAEDSAEYRRKRAIDSNEDLAAGGPRTSFTKLMRNINAPCHGGGGTGGGGTTGGDGADDIVDEARRRMARMRARKAAAGKKKSKTNKKKKSGRRRRQVEGKDLEDLSENKRAEFESEFRAHVQEFSEKINRVYEHISASVMEMMQRMQEHFYDDANGAS